MNKNNQDIKPSLEWLYSRGWTLREAAEFLGVSAGHLSQVLKGTRASRSLIYSVSKLTKKELVLRRRRTSLQPAAK